MTEYTAAQVREEMHQLLIQHEKRWLDRFDAIEKAAGASSNATNRAVEKVGSEANREFLAIREVLDQLLASESRVAGGTDAKTLSRQNSNWLIGLMVMSGLNLAALVVAVVVVLSR